MLTCALLRLPWLLPLSGQVVFLALSAVGMAKAPFLTGTAPDIGINPAILEAPFLQAAALGLLALFFVRTKYGGVRVCGSGGGCGSVVPGQQGSGCFGAVGAVVAVVAEAVVFVMG